MRARLPHSMIRGAWRRAAQGVGRARFAALPSLGWPLLAGLLSALLLWPRWALAQTELELQVSSPEVAVGETLAVQLDAMSADGEAPSDPELAVPNSFELRGPSIGTRQQVSISGFRMVRQSGISATWQLTATRAGVYSIGPGSVQVGGHRQQARAVQIRVVPEGQRQQRPQRRGRRGVGSPFDPFDPFGNDDAVDDLFDRLRSGGSTGFDRLPQVAPELIPEPLPDSLAFLDARLTPEKAVVGQQVTLTIYAHGSQSVFQEAPGSHEPSHPDFLAQRLVEDPSRQPVFQYTRDGQRWIAVKVREIALFPLRSGQLEVGSLELGFLGRRYSSRSAQGLRRSSRVLTVAVSEPPQQGRPPGYAGDVGDFRLSAVVEPRKVTAGGSIAVTARVEGTGRLPGALKLPEQAGVEWLEPTLRDEVTTDGTSVGGTRTFNYVVRMTRPGTIDLGRLNLSFFQPGTQRYRTAPVELGQITVDPEPASAQPSAAPAEPSGPRLSELVKFRNQIEPQRAVRHWTDHAGFWWSLGGAPAFVLLIAGLGSARRRLRVRWERREQSQATHAHRSLTEARQALGRGELDRMLGAVERALYLAIEWSTGLRARALLRSELEPRLRGEGVSAELAAEASQLLGQCSELRRAGNAAERSAASALLGRAEPLVRQLLKQPLRRARPGADLDEARA
jgi:hypothetical protein